MKNLNNMLILFLLGITLTSCNDNVAISKTDNQELNGDTLPNKYPKPFQLHTEDLATNQTGIVLGSDNHEYLVINYCTNKCNVEHYVDCELCGRN